MTIRAKQILITGLSLLFLGSLIFVQWMEVVRKAEEAGVAVHTVALPTASRACIECHQKSSPGIVSHWTGSTHARKGVGCVECHQARKVDADGFDHYGVWIATVVTPRDFSRCHQHVFHEFTNSHQAKAGNILASLDNFLAETVEGARQPFNPHSPTPGMTISQVTPSAPR